MNIASLDSISKSSLQQHSNLNPQSEGELIGGLKGGLIKLYEYIQTNPGRNAKTIPSP